MEKESFEDENVAKLLNEHFISIKVDREERADIDSIYMTVCQMMTGHGGWPLSIFMTPNKLPFYAGTYFPKESRYGYPGFKELIIGLSKKYGQDPEHISDISRNVLEALKTTPKEKSSNHCTDEVVEEAFSHFLEVYDQQYGGFGNAPKFPMPHILMFLLRYYHVKKDDRALTMVVKTLNGLANGGIFDQIGFGFSRYSVDEKFLVPHFEKMLYDNALLIMVYTEAYQITKNKSFKKIAEEIITYVLRDMEQQDGGFYSAEDADSEGVEGKFYVWTPEEVNEVLGRELGNLFCQVYDIREGGNFEGKSIPNLITDRHERYQLDVMKKMDDARKRLFSHRKTRVPPFKDDKILTSWNGLMIAALAKAGKVFGNEEYSKAAQRAIIFLEETLFLNNRIMVRYRDGEVMNKGYIDEYAFVVWAYLEMYETTFNIEFLQKAREITNEMISLFWDMDGGGFFFTGKDHEELLVRQKESYDGAIPSGNSVAAVQMLRLARLTGDFDLEEMVQRMFATFSSQLSQFPEGHTFLLQAYLLTQKGMKEIVILKEKESSSDEELKRFQMEFHPEITLLVSNDLERLKQIAPFTKNYKPMDGKTTVYVCENFACQTPSTDLEMSLKEL